MMNKKASVAKSAGLLCVPLVAFLAVPLLRPDKTRVATKALVREVISSEGKGDVVKRLLSEGADIKWRGNLARGVDLNGTLLHLVVNTSRSTEIAQALLDSGADINAQNVYGVTPLIAATDLAEVGMVRLLLSRGAKVNVRGQDAYSKKIYTALSTVKSILRRKPGKDPIPDASELPRYRKIIQLLEAAGARE